MAPKLYKSLTKNFQMISSLGGVGGLLVDVAVLEATSASSSLDLSVIEPAQ